MKEEIEIKIDEIVAKAKARTFKSGKKGYGFYEKIKIETERFQVSLNIIKLN